MRTDRDIQVRNEDRQVKNEDRQGQTRTDSVIEDGQVKMRTD